METIEPIVKLIVRTQLPTLLVLCVLAALGVLGVVLWRRKDSDEDKSPNPLAAALARFESHMKWAEEEIKSVKTKVDPLVIAVATLNVTMGALKEKVEE